MGGWQFQQACRGHGVHGCADPDLHPSGGVLGIVGVDGALRTEFFSHVQLEPC